MSGTVTINIAKPINSVKILDDYSVNAELSSLNGVDSQADERRKARDERRGTRFRKSVRHSRG
jgi:hypothetical protein